MKTLKRPTIIGGGLTGLAVAYFLKKKGVNAIVLEAANRLGGRIQTVIGHAGTPLELGATWFSDLHMNLLALLEELHLQQFPQYSAGISFFQTKSFEPPQQFFVPQADQPSYRVAGGTQRIIEALASTLTNEDIVLNARVNRIAAQADHVQLHLADGNIVEASQVIICIPPQLASASVSFSPALPEIARDILPSVQTWMAGSIKFTLEYPRPFWRKAGQSGMLYSHAGIVTEMYDHTNFEGDKYGFTGFLNPGAAAYSPGVRKELVLKQLSELFGEEIMSPVIYMDKIWNDECIIKGNPSFLRPHQNNGHPIFSSGYFDGRLHFCGTETASEFAGYMEGAILAAKTIANKF